MADCGKLQGPLRRPWYESNPTYPSEVVDWSLASPAAVEMNSELLQRAAAALKGRYMKSFLVARKGKLCFERYYNGAAANHADNIHSVHKSLLGAMVGVAIDKGVLTLDTSLDQALGRPYGGMDAQKRTITVRHLLTMTSGICWEEDVSEYQLECQDRVQAILSLPQAASPGRIFNYSTADSHLLGAALVELGGGSLCSMMHRHLLEPIGISAKHWGRDGAGYFTAGYNFYTTPREMLKFGELYLRQGQWGGVQIVPPAWVEDSMRQTKTGYGYLFWTTSIKGKQVAIAWGFGGQMIYIIPELDLTVVFTTNTRDFDQDRFDGRREIERFVIPAAS